ncbi:transcriptional regulator, ArsR family [Ignavigranum ruoffiae]|uniref:Transcriptional regulator, ArsR family n=1 Tax=Ignavigranum ruoffiae TaxID=89093 RepID=A0A1H9B3N2_9LACT|nr:metalloregulator ArsR/SmtB family transcription factor [Ignavigranum ruoffiae]SEP83273.1 transcriptional regulator, ArsR family [Ignavigranum ruoffiae]
MKSIDVEAAEVLEKVSVIKVLAHPIRYSIALALYHNGTLNVGAIQDVLSLPQSTVSQHISKLREARVVTASREGTKIFYELSNPIAPSSLISNAYNFAQ